jgi:hypothetical protein
MSVEGTKFQVNYKLADGTLINLYAKDIKDLETGLTDLSMVSTLIKSTGKEFAGGSSAPTVESITKQFETPPVAAPQVVEGQAPTCKHGTMAFRNGTSARGPWKAWMCAAPKGAADKCEAIFLR